MSDLKAPTWDANLYLKFVDARLRPALDLMGRLDPLTKELVYLAISIANQCDYCIASHGTMARQKGMTEEMHEEFMAVVLAAQKGNKIAMAYRVPVDAAFEEG